MALPIEIASYQMDESKEDEEKRKWTNKTIHRQSDSGRRLIDIVIYSNLSYLRRCSKGGSAYSSEAPYRVRNPSSLLECSCIINADNKIDNAGSYENIPYHNTHLNSSGISSRIECHCPTGLGF